MDFEHLGQLNRAWTGGIFARLIEKLPPQLGQENVYRRSSSLTALIAKTAISLARRPIPAA